MRSLINGKEAETAEKLTLSELLAERKVKWPDMVSVELNGAIVERGSFPTTALSEPDRLGIYGLPSIISTTGVVEAPAKPREYYFGVMAGLDEEQVREELKGKFIEYGDPRLTEILKGYTMQAVFYHLFAEPFCEEPDCRLFNAHWQEEMIRAQLQSGDDFCPEHRRVLERLSGT